MSVDVIPFGVVSVGVGDRWRERSIRAPACAYSHHLMSTETTPGSPDPSWSQSLPLQYSATTDIVQEAMRRVTEMEPSAAMQDVADV